MLCEYVPTSTSTEDNGPRVSWEDMKGDISSREDRDCPGVAFVDL